MGVTATRVVKFIRKGVGIAYTDVEYADSTSNSVAPTSGWQTTAPAWQNGHYIWQRIKFTYTDGNTAYSRPVCLSGGKGISSITEYYLATSASSGVTTATTGWTTTVQSVTASKKYLWNYEVVTYTDGTTSTTTPVIIGTYGDKGVGITSITEHYLATSASSGVTRSTSGWTTSIQTVTNTNKYLWNYETVTYTDGTTQDTDPVIIGVYGDTGVGISSVTEYYLATASSSGVTTSTTGWTTTIQSVTAAKKYLWNYEKITYSNGTTSTTTPVIIGTYGDKGVGITSITEHYLATSASSGVTRSTSGWTTSIQTVTNTNKYLWNYETVTYTDGTTQDTDPVIIGVYGDTGNGISSTTAYYLISALRSGVTRSTSGWVANTFQVPTAEKPYAWRYAAVTYTNGTTVYTDAELIAVWQAGANPNLLDDTEFKSLSDLKAWNRRAEYNPVSGQSTPAESNADYVTTGTQGEKAYYSKTNYDTTKLQYKEILGQKIWQNPSTGIKKIEASTWYTFSFYAKGVGCSTYIYPSCVDTNADFFVDGVKKNSVPSDGNVVWAFTGSWVRHTVTFKTKSSFYNSNESAYSDQNILFRLFPKTSTSANNYVYLCMPKLEVGMMATAYMPSKSNLVGDRGPALRGPQAWSDCAVGYSFMQGAENEAYADVVLYNGNYYSCIKSHTKTANNYPTSSLDTTNGYWKLGEKVDLIATRILLATYALVKNLGVEAIDMKDGNGNILFQAKDGAVICKTGTFENVEISGVLNGVTGSFKSLNCVNNNGDIVASIKFGSDGRLWFEDGDLYNQGTKDGRTLRFYSGDIWCRGAFGARLRTALVIKGSYGYYYTKGVSGTGQYVSLSSATSSASETYYKVPCYGQDGDYAGFPVDLLIFVIEANTTYRYELQMAETQRVMVINGEDDYNNVQIYSNGEKVTWAGGEMAEVVKLPNSLIKPTPSSTLLGRGLIVGAFRDNNW